MNRATLTIARQAYLEALHKYAAYDWSDEGAENLWLESQTYRQLTTSIADPDGIDHLMMLDPDMAKSELAKELLVEATNLDAEPGAPLHTPVAKLYRYLARVVEMMGERG